MYAQLGTIVFEGLFGFTELEQEKETSYAEIALVNGKPDLQATGQMLDTISLKVRLHSAFCNPAMRFDQMDMHRLNLDILPFIDGKGNLIGNFVIQKLKQVAVHMDAKGGMLCSECELTLKEYVSPDRIAARALAAKKSAAAIGDIQGLISVNTSVSPSADLFVSVSDTQLAALTVANDINVPDPNNVDAAKGLSALDKVNQGVTDTREKISRYETYVSVGAAMWNDLKADLTAIEGIAAQLTTVIQNGDIANYKVLSEQLLALTGNLPTDGLPLLRSLLIRQ